MPQSQFHKITIPVPEHTVIKHFSVGIKPHDSKFVMLCGTTGRNSRRHFLSIFDIFHEHVSYFFLYILFLHVRAYCKQEKHFKVSYTYNGVTFGFNFKADFILIFSVLLRALNRKGLRLYRAMRFYLNRSLYRGGSRSAVE